MADQRRRTPTAGAARPAGTRRAPARTAATRRNATRRGHARWLGPVLAITAAGLVAVPHLTPVLVDLTAATAEAPVEAPIVSPAPAPVPAEHTAVPPRTREAGPLTAADATPGPALAGARKAPIASPAPVAAEGGLAVPQPPRPGRIVIMPNAAIGTQPTYRQRPDACGGGGTTPRRMVPGVVVGRGTATLDWLADARPEVIGYRVQAVSQRLVEGVQPDPVVQAVAQPVGCVPVSVTMTGLASGVPYVFWLEEQVTSASTGLTRLVQVGTTGAVVIG